MKKTFLILGVVFLVTGLFWPYILKLHLGKLPGDLVLGDKNFKFYFPITTGLIISIIASILLWIFKK